MRSHYRSALCDELRVDRLTDIPGFSSWKEMHRRCSVPGRKEFKNYGGRGIVVCERWQSFENFYRDMGPRPGPDFSIDREDVNGNYEPSNCRWATTEQQAGNRRNNRYVTYRGERMCLRDAIRRAGSVVRTSAVLRRLHFGWPIERAVETQPDPKKGNRTPRGPDHHARVYSGAAS